MYFLIYKFNFVCPALFSICSFVRVVSHGLLHLLFNNEPTIIVGEQNYQPNIPPQNRRGTYPPNNMSPLHSLSFLYSTSVNSTSKSKQYILGFERRYSQSLIINTHKTLTQLFTQMLF